MKKLNLLYVIACMLLVLGSCQKNDEPAPSDTVVGKWQAVSAKGKIAVFGTNEDINENVEQQGLIYEFKADGTFTSNGTLNEEGTIEKMTISGKYTVTGTELKITYRESGQTKDTVEYYKLGLTGSSITLNLTKDLLTKAVSEGDPTGTGALLLSFISSLDITFTFKKI